ncbi:MAG: hypothetical protein IPM23_11370 [Candidatus Melainabacteria bacterium]|nr:hypothetical protein [Candidatus Melainabacteria bacterium]
MRFLIARKSRTFKTHFFSALCRSIFTNASLIFANSVFVKSAGAENYSRLFFFASLATLVYYIFFALRGDKQAFSVYKTVIWITLTVSVLCCLEPFWPPLEPFNIPLLYLFAVSVIVLDLIGTTVGPVVLQLSVNPAIFREVYQKIVTAELLARISAAGLIWLLSSYHLLTYWYPAGWVALMIHFALFNVMLYRLKNVEKESGHQRSVSHDFASAVGKSLRFIFSNPMVRIAMIIMMWGQVSKFVIDFLFFQVADANFSSARKIAAFMSCTTMIMIVLSLAAQHLLGKRLTGRLQLSTLFSIQPVNMLILASAALLAQPFWPVVLLLVTFNIVNRSINLPVSRQCLVPIPRDLRSTIVSLICIALSISTLIASGALAALKGVLHLQDTLVLLLVLGGSIFFLITGMDSFYIRNLWSFYRETRSGHWQEEPVSESLSEAELDSAGVVEDLSRQLSDLKSHDVLDVYAVSHDRDELADATGKHRRMLGSADAGVVLNGLRICFAAGFPWFAPVYRRFLSHPSLPVRDFAGLAIRVQSEYAGLTGYSSVFARRLKSLALELLEQDPGGATAERLKTLLLLPDHNEAEAMAAALSDPRFGNLRPVLLDCIVEDGSRLSIDPLLDLMINSSYTCAARVRMLLEELPFARSGPELESFVERNLACMSRDEIALPASVSDELRDAGMFELFLHVLFADEFRLCYGETDRVLTDTIGEFASLPAEDMAMLVDMHLEFLKRSAYFKAWRDLMI